MNILHTTDLHFNKIWFKWIEDQQPLYDVFCITGDFLDDRDDITLLEQIEWISHWMQNFKKPLIVCSGNHDIEELSQETWLNNIQNIYSDNSIIKINGITFGCIPYLAPEFYEFDNCDVILYHIPPAKTKTSTHINSNSDWGDREFKRILKSRLLSPKIVLSGHMHHPQATKDTINNTIIYNCGVDKSKTIPNHTIIDI